jgi:hypothetical protein
MSNQHVNQGQNNHKEFTTKSVGVASGKQKDLAGIILNPQEIAKAVERMLNALDIPSRSIHSVKVYEKNGSLEISTAIEEDLISERSVKGADIISRREAVVGNKVRIGTAIYNALRNKAYVGKLHYQRVTIKGDPYIVLNFDSEITLAFLYDIPYDDAFYKCVPIDPTIFEEDDDNKRKAKKMHKKLGYIPSGAIITWRDISKGFHPAQVTTMHPSTDRDDK